MLFRSIEDLHTEIISTDGQSQFKVRAVLVVPQALTDEALRTVLEGLATQMMMDIGLDAHMA